MLYNLINFYSYFKNFSYTVVFVFIYEYFFNKCNKKILIKTKNNKKKHVIKSKISLSLIYFTLLLILFYSLSLKIFITLFSSIGILILFLLEKFDNSKLEIFENIDNNKILRYFWKSFYIFINIMLFLFKPISKYIGSYLKKELS